MFRIEWIKYYSACSDDWDRAELFEFGGIYSICMMSLRQKVQITINTPISKNHEFAWNFEWLVTYIYFKYLEMRVSRSLHTKSSSYFTSISSAMRFLICLNKTKSFNSQYDMFLMRILAKLNYTLLSIFRLIYCRII
jgi:hypothetical protein